MAITIDRTARDAIYEEILTELSGSGDIWTEMQSGDYEAVRRTRRRLEESCRYGMSDSRKLTRDHLEHWTC